MSDERSTGRARLRRTSIRLRRGTAPPSPRFTIGITRASSSIASGGSLSGPRRRRRRVRDLSQSGGERPHVSGPDRVRFSPLVVPHRDQRRQRPPAPPAAVRGCWNRRPRAGTSLATWQLRQRPRPRPQSRFSAGRRSIRPCWTWPSRDQALVTLRFFAELSHEEIADILNTSPGAVRTALCRALSRLRERLDADPPTQTTPPRTTRSARASGEACQG